MSDFEVEFVARPNGDHSEPRRWLLGVAMTSLAVIFSVNDVRASCESQEAAWDTAVQHLRQTRATGLCDMFRMKTLTQQQIAACTEATHALEERNKCQLREDQKKEATKRAAEEAATAARLKKDDERRSEILRSTQDFIAALKIGMTAAEADAAEQELFHNPAGWGRTVNTTVTANGTREQWVYRFSQYPFYAPHDVYLYFQNGILTAVQK